MRSGKGDAERNIRNSMSFSQHQGRNWKLLSLFSIDQIAKNSANTRDRPSLFNFQSHLRYRKMAGWFPLLLPQFPDSKKIQAYPIEG